MASSIINMEECPRCGSKPDVRQSGKSGKSIYVKCPLCGYSSYTKSNIYDAISNWNMLAKRDYEECDDCHPGRTTLR